MLTPVLNRRVLFKICDFYGHRYQPSVSRRRFFSLLKWKYAVLATEIEQIDWPCCQEVWLTQSPFYSNIWTHNMRSLSQWHFTDVRNHWSTVLLFIQVRMVIPSEQVLCFSNNKHYLLLIMTKQIDRVFHWWHVLILLPHLHDFANDLSPDLGTKHTSNVAPGVT